MKLSKKRANALAEQTIEQLSTALPNGPWDFLVVGWNGRQEEFSFTRADIVQARKTLSKIFRAGFRMLARVPFTAKVEESSVQS